MSINEQGTKQFSVVSIRSMSSYIQTTDNNENVAFTQQLTLWLISLSNTVCNVAEPDKKTPEKEPKGQYTHFLY